MASPEFVESAVLFKLTKKENFDKFKFSVQDFHLYAKQYKFITQYVDRYGSPPSVEVLHNEFPELDENSKTQKFEFALEQFEEASIGRQTIRAFRDVDSIINENPKQALSNILTSLSNIKVGMDRNLDLYNSGSLDRLDEYRDRVDKRYKG